MGGFGYSSRNQEGEEILDFAVAYDLMIANTFFWKRVPFGDLQQWPSEVRLTLFSEGERTKGQLGL